MSNVPVEKGEEVAKTTKEEVEAVEKSNGETSTDTKEEAVESNGTITTPAVSTEELEKACKKQGE